jgi:hypothetical protein
VLTPTPMYAATSEVVHHSARSSGRSATRPLSYMGPTAFTAELVSMSIKAARTGRSRRRLGACPPLRWRCTAVTPNARQLARTALSPGAADRRQHQGEGVSGWAGSRAGRAAESPRAVASAATRAPGGHRRRRLRRCLRLRDDRDASAIGRLAFHGWSRVAIPPAVVQGQAEQTAAGTASRLPSRQGPLDVAVPAATRSPIGLADGIRDGGRLQPSE